MSFNKFLKLLHSVYNFLCIRNARDCKLNLYHMFEYWMSVYSKVIWTKASEINCLRQMQ